MSAHRGSVQNDHTVPSHRVAMALILAVTALCIAACAGKKASPSRSQSSASHEGMDEHVVLITGPTLIGFFPKVDQGDVDADQDLAEVLSDFQYHLGGAREHLQQKGVSVYELYASEIRIQEAGAVRTFTPDKGHGGLGFYLVSPGREPLVMYGVMTDVDLLIAAHRYFGFPEPAGSG